MTNALIFSVGVFLVSFVGFMFLLANKLSHDDKDKGFASTVIFLSALLSFGVSLMVYGGLS